jgi:flagella basal body P-ring formation protein FlgA
MQSTTLVVLFAIGRLAAGVHAMPVQAVAAATSDSVARDVRAMAAAAPSDIAPALSDTAAADSVWASAQAQVRARVAQAWSVAPDAVVLEWGPAGDTEPAPDAPVELVGSGAGGTWVARVGVAPGAVARRVRAGHRTAEAVAARRLERGSVVAADDIALEERVVWGPPRGDGTTALEGWVAHRVIERGDPLAHPAVRPPLAVASGSPVEVRWQGGAVRLRLAGVAGGSGALGEQIFVRTETGKRLRGTIVAPGVVDVTAAGAQNIRGGGR